MAPPTDSLLLDRPPPLRRPPAAQFPGRAARTRPATPAVAMPLTAAAARPDRDLALDLLRGLAMLILVVNHIHLESALEYATASVLSAAEVLVAVSGVVVGMVFGRRWQTHGPRATTRMLLARARKLYVATVGVVALVGLLVWFPWVATDVVTASPSMAPGADLYAFDGPLRTALAIVTLEAGPWQFSILGLFIALLLATPAILWCFARGWWAPAIAASWLLLAAGRAWPVDVLPAQSERAFPLLVWQALFVHGMALGWYRQTIARRLSAWRRPIAAGVLTAAAVAVAIRLQMEGLAPIGLDRVLGYAPADWRAWEAAHFDKTTLDVARVAAMAAVAGAVYLAFRRFQAAAGRALGWLLLPLGRNSFYVFIMHVFVCLAVALVPGLAGDGLGLVGNTLVQLACVALLWTMVRRRFLFSIVPR